MDKSKVFEIVKKLPLGKKSTIYKKGNLEVFIYRPGGTIFRNFFIFPLKSKAFQYVILKGSCITLNR